MTATIDAEELRQLRDACRGVLAPADDGTAISATGWRERWAALAQLGVISLCVSEPLGGYGLAAEAAVAVAQEIGAALYGSPYAGAVAGAHALAESEAMSAQDLSDVVDGRRVIAFGMVAGPTAEIDHAAVRGVARFVDGAPSADAFILSTPQSRDVLLIEAADCRIVPASYTFDVTRDCADVVFEGAPATKVGSGHVAPELFRLLLAADALGGVQRMLDRTVQYAADRDAFGRPIGGFQAVQHRLVDHTVRLRGMQLVVTEAARALTAADSDARRAVTLAELAVSAGAVHVLHDLLQLTGAIGFTWEYGLHRYERRAHHDARLVGNPRAAARRLAALEGWTR